MKYSNKLLKTFAATSAIAAYIVGFSVPTFAEDDGIGVSANVTLVSDYRFRGVSLSDEDAAIQGTLNVDYQGFHVGTWATSIEQFNGAETEVDVYGGYAFDITDNLSFDAGIYSYLYPGGAGTDYYEIYALASTSLMSVDLSFGANYAPDQGHIGDTDNIYLFTTAGYSIPGTPFSLSGGLGYEDGAFGDDKVDWRIGGSVDYKGLTLGVNYIDSNRADGAIVVSLGASF